MLPLDPALTIRNACWDGLVSENALAELRFEAPAWFSAKWETALDLFRKIEGRGDLPAGAAAEAFAAEWQSGAENLDLNETECAECPEGIPPEWRDVPERDYIERAARRNRKEQNVEECFKRWAYLDADDKGRPGLPAWFEAYNGDLSNDPFVLDKELVTLESARRELDGMSGHMLLTMSRIGLFRPMGFLDIGHYVRERLGMAPSTARRLRAYPRIPSLLWAAIHPGILRCRSRNGGPISKSRRRLGQGSCGALDRWGSTASTWPPPVLSAPPPCLPGASPPSLREEFWDRLLAE